MKVTIDIGDNLIKHNELTLKEIFIIQICNELPKDFSVNDFLSKIQPVVIKYDTAYRVLQRLSRRNLISCNFGSSTGKDLYLIGDESKQYLKIGRSNNSSKRLKVLQTSSPLKLKLLFSIPNQGYEELALHKKFKKLKLINEWFSYDENIYNLFQKKYDEFFPF